MDKKNHTQKSAWRRAEEILGLILLFWGVYTFLALLEKPFNLQLLGSLAELIVNYLSLFFGSYVAFLFPILIIYAAVCLIRHKDLTSLGTKLLGLTLLVVSSCILLALFSLNMSTTRPEEHFYLSGILGNFFVQQDGLRLPSYLGVLGTVLFGGCLLIISAMISFDLSVQTLTTKSKEMGVLIGKTAIVPIISRWRRSSEKKPAGTVRALRIAEKKEQEKPPKVVRRAQASTQTTSVEEPTSKPVILGQPDLFAQYRLPPLSLLDEPPEDHAVSMSDEELERLSEIIEHTLRDYGIETHVGEITQGPVVTRFELHPAPGVKISKILTLEKELAMVLRANSVRIQAPIPGKSAIGIEIPNPKVSIVYLKEMLQSQKLREHRSVLAFALGQTISGEPYICDLTAMPHLLIAGATGSGKSVCINSIISCLLFRQPPDKVKFLMIDPKRVELSVYEDIPHLIAPVICELREAAVALNWLITIMEDRYKQLVEVGMRNITAYNRLAMEGKPHPRIPGKVLEYMPPIVVVIDELADMMLIARQSVEE
ncbi:MAG: DNA translocase FtsK 4TM domain-containing protein, partial [Candidatus Sumerlaeia bacterium]|nr:DNA translocase FtsK 4TM domain-containing protein [Candidatus Sumerlaeia bacterium]